MSGTSAANTTPPGPISYQITPTRLRQPSRPPRLPARISRRACLHSTKRPYTLPPEPPSSGDNKPFRRRRRHCPLGRAPLPVREGRESGGWRECGCAFGFGARSRWREGGRMGRGNGAVW
nr:unnamed protein product [Digitaria exilis]